MLRRSPARPNTLISLAALLLTLFVLLTGAGGQAASAADYPLPTTGAGTVSATSVYVGDCVTFAGGGFQPNAPIIIRDNGAYRGTTQADAQGDFSFRVCFGTNAALGRHVLTATGIGANGELRVVSATVYVLGAITSGTEGSSTGGGGGGGGGGGLPFTGSDIRDMLLLGGLLVGCGSILVLRGKRQQIARRRARAAV